MHAGNDSFGVVTVSIGTATALPGDSSSELETANAMLSAADEALYRVLSH